MEVKFWRYFKRRNSNKYPTTTADKTYTGYLRDGCSVLNPVIDFADDTTALRELNYAYISLYERYYFVEDWTFEAGMWTASMSVDVLGTYSSLIKSSTQYVVRSASSMNSYMIDNIYPVSTKSTITHSTFADDSFYFGGNLYDYEDDIYGQTYATGVFVVGVSGKDASSGGIQYYEIPGTANGMVKFITDLYQITPSDMGSLASGIAKQLANPIQYIASCFWYPKPVTQTSGAYTSQDIPLGFYKVESITCKIVDPSTIATRMPCGGEITFGQHPQQSRGAYMNYAPYSKYELLMNPFGSILLDSTLVAPGHSIYLSFKNDVTNGKAYYEVLAKASASASSYTIIVYKGYAQTGVPISFMERSTDIVGAVTGGISAVGNALMGNWLGAASSVGSAVSSALDQKASGQAATGGVLSWQADPEVQCQFFEAGDAANALVGSPLCQYVRLDTLEGFCQCQNASIANMTSDTRHIYNSEYESIIGYLNNGFFLEA